MGFECHVREMDERRVGDGCVGVITVVVSVVPRRITMAMSRQGVVCRVVSQVESEKAGWAMNE